MAVGIETARLAHTIAGDVRSAANTTRIAARTAAQVVRFVPHPQAKQASRTLGQVARVAGQVSSTARLAQSIARQVIVVQGYTTRSGRRVQGYTRRK
jgi:hypothetical protein